MKWMTRNLLGPIMVLSLVGICFGNQQEVSRGNSVKNYPDGYDGLKWGMSKAEVGQILKDKPEWSRVTFPEDTFTKIFDMSDWQVEATLGFVQNQLYRVFFRYRLDSEESSDYFASKQEFQKAAKLLKLKWGDPDEEDEEDDYNSLIWKGATSSIALCLWLSDELGYQLYWAYYENSLNEKAEVEKRSEAEKRNQKEMEKKRIKNIKDHARDLSNL